MKALRDNPWTELDEQLKHGAAFAMVRTADGNELRGSVIGRVEGWVKMRSEVDYADVFWLNTEMIVTWSLRSP